METSSTVTLMSTAEEEVVLEDEIVEGGMEAAVAEVSDNESCEEIVQVGDERETAYGDDGGGSCTPPRDVVENTRVGGTEVGEPAVGMVFPTWEDADKYFRNYGRKNGFGVLRYVAASRKIVEGKNVRKVWKNYFWKCECSGTVDRRRNVNGKKVHVADGINHPTRKTKKCGCPVMMYGVRVKGGEWLIRKVVTKHEGHNPTPSKGMTVPSFRQEQITSSVRRKLEMGESVGVRVGTIHRVLAKERNGVENIGITKKDLHNIVQKKRRLQMEGGDANSMIRYFRRMSADNDKFFYVHREDKDGFLTDMLWVDARSRAAYEEFGDVVSFDTTYLVNSYDLPFANFVGVNHHGQTILLGCALLSQENIETFVWIFSKWLECMGGKYPGGILTDQDQAMRKALAIVMPEVKHRWCLWHVIQKFCGRLGARTDYDDIKKDLHGAIYDSLTGVEFESRWKKTIDDYGLGDNIWLTGLFEEREMWIPAYSNHVFWAGMKTTQRSESIHNFFNGFLMKSTRLRDFAEKYIDAMEHRANEEKLADGNNYRGSWQLVTGLQAEEAFKDVYTSAKFREVQVQCARVLYVIPIDKKQLCDDVYEHTFIDRVWKLCSDSKAEILSKETREYFVTFNNKNKEASCICKMFESRGIICRHLIRAYEMNCIEIPEWFILRRWRKDVIRGHTKMKVAYHDPTKTEEVKRQDKMMVEFEQVCFKAAASDDLLSIVMEGIQLIDVRLDEKKLENEERTAAEPTAPCTPSPATVLNRRQVWAAVVTEEEGRDVDCPPSTENENVKDPKSKKKSKKKSGRMKSAVEKAWATKSMAPKSRKGKKYKRGRLDRCCTGEETDNNGGQIVQGFPFGGGQLLQGPILFQNGAGGQVGLGAGYVYDGGIGPGIHTRGVVRNGCVGVGTSAMAGNVFVGQVEDRGYLGQQGASSISVGGIGLANSGCVGYYTSPVRPGVPTWVIRDCMQPNFMGRS